jgi:geranylgeranyl diphosphate synthase type II
VISETTSFLEPKRARLEDGLREVLRRVADAPPLLCQAMQYSLLAKGKRLRPILVMLAAEACGGDDGQAMPAACAVELIHAYSLIHDDLPAMDDDDLRRGQPTCHKKFGEAAAILAGDALLTLAFQVLAEGYPPVTGAACCRELAAGAGARGMVGGQVDDLAWEGRIGRNGLPPASVSDLRAIHARKTGALFQTCVRLGAYAVQGEQAGGPDRDILETLTAYGECFGQAFQITDDLLDVEGDADQTGKRVRKDAARGKITYPTLLGLEESRSRAEDLCRQAADHAASLGPAGERLGLLARELWQRAC